MLFKIKEKHSPNSIFRFNGVRYNFNHSLFNTEDKDLIEHLKNSKMCIEVKPEKKEVKQ